MRAYILILFVLILSTGCNSEADKTILLTMQRDIEKTYCGAQISCGNFSMSKYSKGKTNGMQAQIVKFEWYSYSPKGKHKQCSYYHFIMEDGLNKFLEIISSNPNFLTEDNCGDIVSRGCFGCGEVKFVDYIKNMGYSGDIPH